MKLQGSVVFACALMAASGVGAQDLDVGLRQARRVPEWMNKLTIYQVWLRSFSPEGNLKGVTARLPYIAELGAGLVYLSPIAKQSDRAWAMPYNVADYNRIDPEYGAEADLRELVSAAHKLGLKVMLDVVYYHTAADATAVDKPGFVIRTPEGKPAAGYWKQPRPDFNNPEVRRFLVDSLVHWVKDFNIDGFRCDVADAVPLSFWEEARTALDRINPELILLSEGDRPADQLKAFDINYNFEYHITLRKILREGDAAIQLREQWESARRMMPQGARLLHYSETHDWRHAVVEFGEIAAKTASILNFMLDGIPFVFAGQEIAERTPTRHWTRSPIHWEYLNEPMNDSKEQQETLALYRKLFKLRREEPALTSGELIWVNNSRPESVLSFLRHRGADDILVVVNLSNRKTEVRIDLPVADYYSVNNLLKDGKTWFPLYGGQLKTTLAAYDSIVAKRIVPGAAASPDQPPSWWKPPQQTGAKK